MSPLVCLLHNLFTCWWDKSNIWHWAHPHFRSWHTSVQIFLYQQIFHCWLWMPLTHPLTTSIHVGHLWIWKIRKSYQIKSYQEKMSIQARFKGGLKSEDMGEFLLLQINIPNHYPEQKIWISVYCLRWEI